MKSILLALICSVFLVRMAKGADGIAVQAGEIPGPRAAAVPESGPGSFPAKIGIRLQNFLTDSLADEPGRCIEVNLMVGVPSPRKTHYLSDFTLSRQMDSALVVGKKAIEAHLGKGKVGWLGKRSGLGNGCLTKDEIEAVAGLPELEWLNHRKGNLRTFQEGGSSEASPEQ